jgi:hypothetical protein
VRVIDQVASPGDGICDEDRAGASDWLAWIVDGATSLSTTPFLPARTDADWLATHVDGYLRGLRAVVGFDAGQLLGAVASDVAEALWCLDFPPGEIPPACSCGVVTRVGQQVLLAIVGDVTLYLAGYDVVLEDPSFRGREAAGVRAIRGAAGSTGGFSAAEVDSIAGRRRKYITGELGSYVLSNNPGVRAGVRQVVADAPAPARVLLATDGFARLVDTYVLFQDWPSLLAEVDSIGLAGMVAVLRRYEAERRTGSHYKARDDAAALLVDV